MSNVRWNCYNFVIIRNKFEINIEYIVENIDNIDQLKQELENVFCLQRGIGMIMPYQQCAGLRVFVCGLHDQALLSHLNHYNIRSPANQVPANISFSLDIQ